MTPAQKYVEENFTDVPEDEKVRLGTAAAGYAAECLRQLRQNLSHKTIEEGSE
jgi:hypothetical protein